MTVITTYVARFSNIIGLFLLFPLVAHAVSPATYGVYLLVASVATLVQMDLGMASSTIRFIAKARTRDDLTETRQVIASSTWFFVLLGLVCATGFGLIFFIGWKAFDIPEELVDDTVILVALSCIQIFVGLSTSVHRQVLTGVGDMSATNFIQLAQLCVRMALTILMLAVGAGIVGVGIVDTVAVALGGLATWLHRRRSHEDTNTRILEGSWQVFKSMFRLNADLLVLSVSALVILQSSNLILSFSLPIATVAVFGAGYRCYQVCREVTNSLTSALLPVATSNHAAGLLIRNQDLYLTGTKFANALLLLVAIPVIVFAPQFLQAWVGSQLAAGYIVAQILILSLIANNNHLLALPILTGQGKVSGYATLHAIWAITTIGLGLWLAPRLGVSGMALAVAAPITVLEPLYISIALRRLNLRWKAFMGQVAMPTLVPAGLLGAIFYLIAAMLKVSQSNMTFAIAGSILWAASFSAVFLLVGVGSQDRKRLRGFIFGAPRTGES